MLYGLCAFAAEDMISLHGVTSIVILNRFEGSGWVFEGGAAECKAVMTKPKESRYLQLIGRTHLYSSLDREVLGR